MRVGQSGSRSAIKTKPLSMFLKVYYLELKENIPEGSMITTVRATDLDDGVFGEVSYYIPQERNSIVARKLISVDTDSGEVRLLQALDREAISK